MTSFQNQKDWRTGHGKPSGSAWKIKAVNSADDWPTAAEDADSLRLCLHRLPPGLGRAEARQAGRHWLLAQLARVTGVDVTREDMAHSVHGKPFVNGLGWSFSYSNSHGFVALAAWPGEARLGLDLEKIETNDKTQRNRMKLAARYFSTTEQQALRQVEKSTQPAAFYALWTAKEAATKCVGGRLWLNLKYPALPVCGPVPLRDDSGLVLRKKNDEAKTDLWPRAASAETGTDSPDCGFAAPLWLHQPQDSLMLCLWTDKAIQRVLVNNRPGKPLALWYWPA